MDVNADVADSASEPNERISELVIAAVADAKGVEPWDLDTPLYDVVDPDALNRIFRSTGRGAHGTGRIIFTMDGCEVVVHGDGDVDVTPPGDDVSADVTSTGSTE